MTDVDVERFRAAVRAVRSSRSVVLITEEVLALLDRLEAAEAENERLREWSDKHCTAATRGTDAAHALRQQVEELTAENEKFRQKVEWWCQESENQRQQVEELTAEKQRVVLYGEVTWDDEAEVEAVEPMVSVVIGAPLFVDAAFVIEEEAHRG